MGSTGRKGTALRSMVSAELTQTKKQTHKLENDLKEIMELRVVNLPE